MNNRFILIALVIVAFVVRVIFLDQFPNGFTGDEAQQGYSAYSIFKTGKDEWGEFLPINPRGFGDFKPPLYTYLTVPAVALFDLTIFAVRLPAAVLGTLLILITYFLARQLTKNSTISLWAAFLLTISPWHIQLSRTAWEGGVGMVTFCLGLLFYLKSRENNRLLFLSIIFWGLTLYTYHSFRIFTVLFIVTLFILEMIKLKKIRFEKDKVIAFVLFFIFFIPLILNFKNISTRASDVSIFSKPVIEGYFKNKGVSPLPVALDKVFDNKYLATANNFVTNYLSYYSPVFFFTGSRSDGTYLNFPKFELLYLIELIFWLFALWEIIFKRLQNRQLLLIWFLWAPISAALTLGQMNANRAPTFLPLTAIISAIGVDSFIRWLKDKFKLTIKSTTFISVVILSISFLNFLHFYFVTLPQNPPENLRYGYDQVFKKVLTLENKYNQIVFSKAFTEPQIFVAFYAKINPADFQKSSPDWLRYEKSDKLYVDQLESWNLGKFYFEDLDWVKKDAIRKNALIISTPEDFPNNVNSLLDAYSPKRKLLYRLVPTND